MFKGKFDPHSEMGGKFRHVGRISHSGMSKDASYVEMHQTSLAGMGIKIMGIKKQILIAEHLNIKQLPYNSKPSLKPKLASNQITFWFDEFN